jgi:hypothetical protein
VWSAVLPLIACACPEPPPLADLERFPPAEVVRLQLEFNRAVQEYLELRLAVAPHHGEALSAALGDTRRLHAAWDLLGDAQNTAFDEDYRRSCLDKLRDRLDFPAYSHGAMPPAVPYWLFPEID